ncbi:MAG TPA: polysaccharide deacetylase family protein, partial [Symbiobacteriaceae bacterium]|nr:polysaccharide deacetylase family protein [Symbiobacteriaceae bacterium]
RLISEVTESRAVLEEKLGIPVRFFCYPVGRHNDQVVAAVQEAGYVGAVTTKPGVTTAGQHPLRWTRVRISKGTSPAGLAALLR